MSKQAFLNIAKGGFMAISLIASVINVIDISTTFIQKCRRPKTVTGFSGAATNSTEE